VKVKVAACAICHSDIHSFRGEHGKPPLPAIGGHEVAGYIEEVGADACYVKKGDPVVVSIVKRGCGECYFCSVGLSNMCQNRPLRAEGATGEGLSAPGRYTNKKGQRLTQLGGTVAGFAEYITVSEYNVIKIPADVPMDRACLLGCGVISGYGAVVNRAKVPPHSSVVVMGAGGVGLNAIQGARLNGAYPIIAVDVLDNKLEAARKFGATHTVNTKKDANPVKTVWELTSGRGADYVIIAVAGLDILRQGFNMSGFSGTTVVVGHGANENLAAFAPVEFVAGRTLTGSAMGASRLTLDIPRLITYYKAGRLKLDELISNRYPLEKINEAIESSLQGEALRNVIVF
jgi:S-(hydroxymethyl)glutathione dehydrogenase / alcohol dehydrogenase